MRRLVGWISGAVGGITAYRLVRRRGRVAPEAGPDARAEELRERLAESRVSEPTGEEQVAEEDPAPEQESPEERRQRVHDEGRAALDEMRPE